MNLREAIEEAKKVGEMLQKSTLGTFSSFHLSLDLPDYFTKINSFVRRRYLNNLKLDLKTSGFFCA